MNLPDLAYGWRKLKSDILAIRGINYSDAITDGDLADSEGVSTRRFPYIATLRGRTAAESWLNEKNPSSVHRYNDHIIAVSGEELLCDNKKIGVVAPGEKQFVTINTKVVVFPDKLILDMTHNPPAVRDMAASFVTVGKGTVMEHNKLTIPETPLSDKQAFSATFDQRGDFYSGFWFQTYKNLAWDGGKYTWESIEWKEIASGESIAPGDILIPKAGVDSTFLAQYHITSSQYDIPPSSKEDIRTEGNGYYLQVKEVVGNPTYVSNGRVVTSMYVRFNVFNFAEKNPVLKTLLRKGDAVSVDGHPLRVNNKDVVITLDVTDGSLVFSDDTFVPADGFATLTEDDVKEDKMIYLTNIPETGKFLTITNPSESQSYPFETEQGEFIKREAGQIVAYKIIDKSSASAWLITEDEKVYKIKTHGALSARPQEGEFPTVTTISDLRLTIKRVIPDMDYICEKDNRLWGVVNKQHNRVWDEREKKWAEFDSRMIVASSLGMPDDFYDYNGVYSGAYAVAVASEGDFTGICAYGDSVLAWKEKKLCKVLGDSPSSYAMHDYTMDGLQSGAQGTQVNIKESLIYKGVNGIYAYGGGVSRLISPQFGERRYTAKSAGTDGERYYITLIDKDGKHHLHSYDIERGIWLRESGENVTGYIDLPDGGFSALVKLSDTESVVKRMDTGSDDSSLSWYAQFAPIYETLDGKKRYAKLLLRLEIGTGANVQIKERVDGKPWMLIGRITGSTQSIVTIPVPIVRGDKVEFRLEGKGACTILGIQRQFYVGSEV